MTRLERSKTSKLNKPVFLQGSFGAYLSLAGSWIFVNVYAEFLEEFSFWLETGFAIAQWFVLQHYLRPIKAWILMSAVGWIIGFLLIHVVNVGDLMIDWLPPTGELTIGGELIDLRILWIRSAVRLLEWAIIGFCQWLVLRCHINHSSWWILASALGGAIKGPTEFTVRLTAEEVLYPDIASQIGAMSGAFAYGVITSIVLVWLLKERLQSRPKYQRR